MTKIAFMPFEKRAGDKKGEHVLAGYALVPMEVTVDATETPASTTQASSLGQPFPIAKLILPPEITSLGKVQTLREYINSIGLPWETVEFEDLSYPPSKG